MCSHTSIIALFRFELLNYFSIHVELRISKYLPTSYICRTNESPGKSHIDSSPILPTSTVFVVSHDSCRHLSARSGKPSLNNMSVDIGTQYPHKHHNYSHCSDFSTVDPKVQDRFHKNGEPLRLSLSPSRRAGFKGTSSTRLLIAKLVLLSPNV